MDPTDQLDPSYLVLELRSFRFAVYLVDQRKKKCLDSTRFVSDFAYKC